MLEEDFFLDMWGMRTEENQEEEASRCSTFDRLGAAELTNQKFHFIVNVLDEGLTEIWGSNREISNISN